MFSIVSMTLCIPELIIIYLSWDILNHSGKAPIKECASVLERKTKFPQADLENQWN